MGDESSNTKKAAPRKMKFAPKIPPRKIPKPEAKIETPDGEDALNKELLKRVKEGFGKSGPKIERKSAPVQVAFGHGDATTAARSFGFPRGPSSGGSNSKGGGNGSSQGIVFSTDGGSGSIPKMTKEYFEPWDYYSHYPVTLPLRRPYSGNPELLDEEEFGETSVDFDETHINPATELGLTEREDAQMIFFQLPPSLPMMKRLASAKDKEIADDSKPPSRRRDTSEKGCSLEDLPAGFMGKMLVYKSGAIKMKLGDILFDVSAGSDCTFAQDVAAINVEEKQCCILGELKQAAIVTAEIDSLVDGIANLD